MPSSQYPSSERTTKVSRRAFLLAAGGGVAVGSSRAAARLRNATTVRIDGTPAHLPLSNDVRDAYESPKNPPLSVDANGTSSAIRRFVAGGVDILFSGRPLTTDERASAKSNGVSFAESEIIAGGATLASSSSQWQRSLRTDQLEKAWHTGSEWATWAEFTETNAAAFAALPMISRRGRERTHRQSISANSETIALAYGPREYQYSEGKGGVGYYDIDTDDLRPKYQSGSIEETARIPLARIIFKFVNTAALRQRAIATLSRKYDKRWTNKGDTLKYYSPSKHAQDGTHLTMGSAAGIPQLG